MEAWRDVALGTSTCIQLQLLLKWNYRVRLLITLLTVETKVLVLET